MIRCTWFESNYSRTGCQSSKNVAAVVQVLRKKKDRGPNYFLHQNQCKLQFHSPLFNLEKIQPLLLISCPIRIKLAELTPNRMALWITLLLSAKLTN